MDHLRAQRRERLALLAGAGIASIVTWVALDVAGGRLIEEVWPLAAVALVAGIVGLALTATAALTGGTVGEVRPASGHVVLRRGVGWLGARSVCLRFEDIASVDLEGEQLSGEGTVILGLIDGCRVAIHGGSDASRVADHIRTLVAADRR